MRKHVLSLIVAAGLSGPAIAQTTTISGRLPRVH
jgi:hypothetical protein